MNKKLLFILVLSLLFIFSTAKALASLTLGSASITGTASSTLDLGSGHDLFLQTSGGTVNIGTTTLSTDSATLNISGNSPIEAHSNFANGIALYTHSNAQFRAPYLNFFKSNGTQTSPTAVQSTAYEADSIGGINFGGWDGSTYFGGSAAIYTSPDEDWTPTHHGGHLSIYGTNNASNTQQIAQFGGLDSTQTGTTNNIIFNRPLSWIGNSSSKPAIFPSGSPPTLAIRAADDSVDAALTSLTIKLTARTFASLDFCASGTEGKQAAVTDSSTATWGAAITGGGANHVLAYCNGTNWTVMGK